MKQRYHLLDALRGLAIVMMVAYHTTWDLIYIFGVDSNLLRTSFAGVWQAFAACTFIALSGFCWSMSRRPLQNGAICFGFGALMTVITLAIMPQNRVVFGVLTLLGSCMLLMVPLDKLLRKVPPIAGFAGSVAAFVFTRNINTAVLGVGEWCAFTVPSWLYQNNLTAYLGFPYKGFYSTDYFSLLPWFFLFCSGYFFYHLAHRYFAEDGAFWHTLQYKMPPLCFLGRHSLVIYLFHQPVIYGMLYLYFVGFS